MKHRAYIILYILTPLLLLTSCGQEYEAKQKVKAFFKENAVEEIDIRSFSKLDSTRLISDSLINVFRNKKDDLFNSPIDYTARQGKTLYFIRMKYQKDTLELSKTFYFNPDLEGIIAFK